MGTWTDPPLFWFKPDHDVEVVSNLEAGTLRIHLQVSPSERRLQALGLCIAFFVFSLLPSTLVLSWHSESLADDVTRQRQTSCAGLGMSTLLLGDDDVYCIDPMFPDGFQSDDTWQLGEEQHLAIGSDGNGGYAEEYRWAAVEHWVVYGYVWEGRYSCHIYIPETNLPSDWNLTHLMSPFPEGSWPTWCDEPVSENPRNYTNGTHPYVDIWMFEVGEAAELELYIWAHKETDGAYWYQEWVSLENYAASWDESSTYFSFPACMLFITVPVGVLVLMAAYSNPRLGMEVNHQQRTVVRQQFGRLSSVIKKTLHGVDVESLTLRPNRRSVYHTDDFGSSTTEHPGVDLIVNTGRGVHALAFVENDDTGERHELIAKLSSAIRGQVVDASSVESDAPSLVEPGADSSERVPVGASSTPVDEQLVIEQVAPVEVIGAFSAVRDDMATDDGKHRPRDTDSESMGVTQTIQSGGFWNFEAEDAKE